MMASLKQVDQSIKDCINGCIKQCQLLLPTDNPYYNISELVIYWVILFYYIGDQFDVKNSSNGYRISCNNSTVTFIDGYDETVFLTYGQTDQILWDLFNPD